MNDPDREALRAALNRKIETRRRTRDEHRDKALIIDSELIELRRQYDLI